MQPVIHVRGLVKRYGSLEAVRGLDLDVHAGEVVAVLGPNGAGKTTTVEILEGFRTRDGGEVSVLGEDPRRAPTAWRSRIGVVLQESEPPRLLTVTEALEMFRGYFPRPREVGETIAQVGLAPQAGQRVGKLSSGQRRRLDVGLALVGDPELLFLDEPTTGFDPAARREAWEVIGGLRELGKTILLTTHYMDEAQRLADRVVVVKDGRVVAEGAPDELGGRAGAVTTISFGLPAGVAPPVAAVEGPTGRFELRSERPVDDLAVLTTWAREHGHDLPGLEVRRPTLEDVYLELTA